MLVRRSLGVLAVKRVGRISSHCCGRESLRRRITHFARHLQVFCIRTIARPTSTASLHSGTTQPKAREVRSLKEMRIIQRLVAAFSGCGEDQPNAQPDVVFASAFPLSQLVFFHNIVFARALFTSKSPQYQGLSSRYAR